MRLLLTGILLAAAAWSGYWFWGAAATRSGFDTWFEARRGDGWVADRAGFSVSGFPNRFDAEFTGLTLADPGTGLAWTAPRFQVLALSYRPNHVIAVWPGTQRIATPYRKYRLHSEDMRASLVCGRAARSNWSAARSRHASCGHSRRTCRDGTAVSALTLAAEHVPADPSATYRLGLSADGLEPSRDWRSRIGAGSSLPETLDALSADLTVRFDKPWDRTAVEQARPQPRHIRLRLAEARWGRLELQAAGELSVNADGRPDGTVTVKARNWREILALATGSDALPRCRARPAGTRTRGDPGCPAIRARWMSRCASRAGGSARPGAASGRRRSSASDSRRRQPSTLPDTDF